jgi:hypothetical protein
VLRIVFNAILIKLNVLSVMVTWFLNKIIYVYVNIKNIW